MANPAPVIGQWYRRPGGDSFEVVAVDPDDRTIEIQYFDGTIEELELEEWLEYEAEPAGNGAWGDPLQSLDRGEVAGYSELELSETPDEADRY
jgi:hypothetical protein